MKTKIIYLTIAVGLLLLIPVFGNMYVEGWNWSVFDFVWAGAVLFGFGLAYLYVSNKSPSRAYKAAVGIAVFTGLTLVWINGAVGIIGDGDNGMNLLYFAVLLIGIISAAVSRFSPRGMSRTLFIVAIGQMIVPTLAFIFWKSYMMETPGILGVFALNAVFMFFWIASALLFRHANAMSSQPR